MPVTKPLVVVRNFTPSSTELVSGSVAAGVAVPGQIVHGQLKVLAVVVNDQVTGSITLPAVSVAPLRVAV